MLAREQDIVRFDVSVHHALLMSVGQCVHHFLENPHHFAHGQLPLPHELRPERLALDERHDVVEEIIVRSGGEQRHDVRVLQPGGELNLALEPVDAHPSGHFRREHLDDDLAAESDFLREEDAAHAAAA